MNTTRLFLACSLMALLGNPVPGRADDIDLYSSITGAGTGLPNVLFVLDNAAAFNANNSVHCEYFDESTPSMIAKNAGIEQCALVNAIRKLPLKLDGSAALNVGIMVYNQSGWTATYGCDASGLGGCLVRPLTAMTTTARDNLITWIKSWDANSIASNNEQTAQTMQEAWAYYAGKTGISGRDYASIVPALSGCQKNYVIFIGNAMDASGSPGDPASSPPDDALTTTVDGNTALTADQKTLLKSTIQIAAGPYGTSAFSCGDYAMGTNHTKTSGLYADEWARYMHDVDISLGSIPSNRKVVTYTIGALSTSCKPDYPALLTSMAISGGGKYFATANAAEISQSILRIFNEVQAVNSVFSSSSLPVSVNTQGTFLNQVFMGMFRPDQGGNPRWRGNLKQYKFTFDATTQILALADALDKSAISSAGTGFISANAASFWTCGNANRTKTPKPVPAPFDTLPACNNDPAIGFWYNDRNGAALGYDLPDGEVVEKGGAAQMLRLANLLDDYTATPGSASNPRKLYTCLGCLDTTVALSSHIFDRSNAAITDTLLTTGPQDIASITSPAWVTGAFTPSSGGAASSITITNFSKGSGASSDIITATVASTTGLVAGTTQFVVSTSQGKYNCTACTVDSIIDSTHFTYTSLSGAQAAPATPYVAQILANFVTVVRTNHGLAVGQTMTISSCGTYTTLNGTDGTVSSVIDADTFKVAVSVVLTPAGADTTCQYAVKTATVTTVNNHGFASGAQITIAGAGGSTTTPYTGFNGIWTATVTGNKTFTYQYTAAAPLANCSPCSGATATSSTTTRDALTRWVRGEDIVGDEPSLCPPGSTAGVGNCPSPAINIRPSVHGDVLHSRPVVLNYGGTNGVIAFYGGNDGVFRAVNGNQVNPSGSTLPNPGSELWGLIPEEFLGKLKRLHDNSPIVQMPSTLAGLIPTPEKKDYFVDGSTGVYQVIDGDGITQTANLYLAMRRGGRMIYALSVGPDPTAPAFLWKRDNTFTGYSELGQTWSQPKVASVKGHTNPVLIFAAGYDANAQDAEPPTADSMGRGIFILDAITGNPVWKATYGATLSCPNSSAACTLPEMTYSIPSDVTLLDRNGDGKIDRLYVGDMGGNVWRVDLEPSTTNFTPEFWQAEKLAALGCNTGVCGSGVTPRKIFYPPEVITTGSYDMVFVPTGDREHPLYTDPTSSSGTGLPYSSSPPYDVSACGKTNRAYLLKDMATGPDGSGLSALTESDLFDATSTNWDGTKTGYYVTFKSCEKSVNAPLVVAGYVYFGTNQAKPVNAAACDETLGVATGYRLSPFTGKYISAPFEGGGLPPSPVSGIVNIVDQSGNTIQVPFCIGCGGGGGGCASDSSLEGCKPPIDVNSSRYRTYWYIEDK